MDLNVKFDEMSVAEYVEHLYSETDENNMLCIPGWDDEDEDNSIFYSAEMTWNKDDIKNASEKCSAHIKQIEDVEGLLIGLNGDENLNDILNTKQYAFWDQYLRPFEDHVDIGDFEDEKSIDGKVFFGKELTKSEQQTYDAYCSDLQEQSKERLGYNNFAYDVLIRSMRYFKLLMLGAPSIITSNEKRILIESLIFFDYCSDLTKVEGIH